MISGNEHVLQLSCRMYWPDRTHANFWIGVSQWPNIASLTANIHYAIHQGNYRRSHAVQFTYTWQARDLVTRDRLIIAG